MSANPWMKRHKRYLSFRYIFPRVAAAGISFRRGLLRMGWFFTHSLDELLDDVRRVLRRLLAMMAQAWSGAVGTLSRFVKGLTGRIESGLHWFGRLPVWTGAAMAGIMGIVLTLLLFLLPAIQARPVPASIGSDVTSVPPAALSVTRNDDVAHFVADETDEADEKNVTDDAQFDPFAPLPGDLTVEVLPQSRPEPEPFVPVPDQPELFASWSRLSMPLGWESGRRVDVVSFPKAIPKRDGWMAFAGSDPPDGWEPSQAVRPSTNPDFSPYVPRGGNRLTSLTPRWITPEAAFGPASRVVGRRQPSVAVEKAAPQTAAVGQPFDYTLIVTNVGDEMLDSVQIRERVSAIDRVAGVEPSANVVGDSLVWDLTDLQPGERRRLQITIQADEPITLAQHTTVEVTSGVGALSEVRHPRPEPPLAEPESSPEPTPPPTQVESEPASEQPRAVLPDFGAEPAESAPAEEERLTGEPRPELMPWAFDSANGPPPQQEEPSPQQEPLLPSDAPAATQLSEAVAPEAPEPEVLAIEMSTPSAVAPGSDVRTFFVLRNRGETDLTNVVLAVELSDELQHRHGRTLELRLDRLAAGETYRTRLTTRAVQDGNARISSRVRCPDSREQTTERDVRISRNVARPTNVANDGPGGCVPVPCPCEPSF